MKKLFFVIPLILLVSFFITLQPAEAKYACREAPFAYQAGDRPYQPKLFIRRNWCRPTSAVIIPLPPITGPAPVIPTLDDPVWMPPLFDLYDNKFDMMNLRMRIL